MDTWDTWTLHYPAVRAEQLTADVTRHDMEPLQAKLAGGRGEQLEYFEQLAGETMALTSGVEAGQVVLPQLLSGWKYYQKQKKYA